MYLERISINNFKAVKSMEIEFTPGVNLLIGDNGVGKTSVLEAIAVVRSGMLKGMNGVPTKNILQNDIHFVPDESCIMLKWNLEERSVYLRYVFWFG